MLYLAQPLALIRKELLATLKDPSSRTLLFAPALMQALLFDYGATYDLTHAPFAVWIKAAARPRPKSSPD